MWQFLKFAGAICALFIVSSLAQDWPLFERWMVAGFVGCAFGFYKLHEENKRLWNALGILHDRINAMQRPPHDIDDD